MKEGAFSEDVSLTIRVHCDGGPTVYCDFQFPCERGMVDAMLAGLQATHPNIAKRIIVRDMWKQEILTVEPNCVKLAPKQLDNMIQFPKPSES